MVARVKDFYRGYIIELTRGADHWFLSALVGEQDGHPLTFRPRASAASAKLSPVQNC